MNIVLSACAGRALQPVAVVQSQDRYVDCAGIAAEVQENNQQIQEPAPEEGAKVGQNVAAGVAGLFIWPLWFAMDFQGTASKEVTALQSRQQFLGTLAEQKGCGEPPVAIAKALVSSPPERLTLTPPPPTPPAVSTETRVLANPSLQEAGDAHPTTGEQTALFPVTVNNRYQPPPVYVR